MSLLDVQRLGSAVLLQGTAVRDAAYLVATGIRALENRDGIGPVRRWVELHRALRAVAESSDNGNAEVVDVVDQEVLPAEVVSTAEAAVMLRISQRQVRNLAPRLGAVRVGRAYLYDRDVVAAEAKRKTEETSG